MKVLGLILELNPYHNGHKYFIQKAKDIVKPDITIAIISSSFMMRGDPMILDKFSKTKILLNENIDLVLELPFISGTNNCDYFCTNSVNILKAFGITDLCFGAETDNISILNRLVELNKSMDFNSLIKKYLNNGFSYSTSANKAILELTNDISIATLYSQPNNTLAIGYLKALHNTSIKSHIIKRINNNYYDEHLNFNNFSSATALRNELKQSNDISEYIPNYLYNFYNSTILENELFKLLQFKLINNTNLQNIKGVNEGIENRLISFINSKNYDDFINNVATKRYTINKIKRLILYILLDIPKKYEHSYDIYLRILGMNDNGAQYVNSLNKIIKKQIITTFKNSVNELINIELKASKLYGIITNNYDFYKNEFNIPYRKDKI